MEGKYVDRSGGPCEGQHWVRFVFGQNQVTVTGPAKVCEVSCACPRSHDVQS